MNKILSCLWKKPLLLHKAAFILLDQKYSKNSTIVQKWLQFQVTVFYLTIYTYTVLLTNIGTFGKYEQRWLWK